MSSCNRAIGANIRRLRIQNNMTQDELAESVFVTRQTISNYETGRSNPDIDMLLHIAESLKTDLNSLLYGKQLPYKKQASRKRTRNSLMVFALLAVVTAVLYPLTYSMKINSLIAAPNILVRLLSVPLLMLVTGWTVMQVIDYTVGINHRKSGIEKYLRLTVCGILLINIVIVLPYIVWLFIIVCHQLLNADSIHMLFPYIPLYQETAYFFMNFMYNFHFIYLLFGISLWLFCPNNKNLHLYGKEMQ